MAALTRPRESRCVLETSPCCVYFFEGSRYLLAASTKRCMPALALLGVWRGISDCEMFSVPSLKGPCELYSYQDPQGPSVSTAFCCGLIPGVMDTSSHERKENLKTGGYVQVSAGVHGPSGAALWGAVS